MNTSALIWRCSSLESGLCSRIFGIITTYCISKDLGIKFFIKWVEPDISSIFTISGKYLLSTHIPGAQHLTLSDRDMMLYFENEDIETKCRGKAIIVPSGQNLYQHFCYNRPKCDYKNNLLRVLTIFFPKIFSMDLRTHVKLNRNLNEFVGIHVRTNAGDLATERERSPYITDVLLRCKHYMDVMNHGKKVFISSDCDVTFVIAKRIFGDSYTLLYNRGRLFDTSSRQWCGDVKNGLERFLMDLLSLTKCKTLYLAWNSNFSRLGAILNPFRTFYTYEHPKHFPGMHKCPVDELMSYYKQSKKWAQ